MANNTIVTFTNYALGDGNTLSFEIDFTTDGSVGNLLYEGRDVGVLISDPGTRSAKVDLEEKLTVVGTYRMAVADGSNDGRFMAMFNNPLVSDQAMVTIRRNASVFFKGQIRDNSIEIDQGNRVVSFEVQPDTSKVNRVMLEKPDGTANNPLDYDIVGYEYHKVSEYLADFYELATGSVPSVTMHHDWTIKAYRVGDSEPITDGTVSELELHAQDIFASPFKFGKTLGEVIQAMAEGLFMFIGMVDTGRVIAQRLFAWDAGNVQVLGRIYRSRLIKKFHKMSYVRCSNASNVTLYQQPNADAFTGLEGDFYGFKELDVDWAIHRPTGGGGAMELYVAPVINDPVVWPAPTAPDYINKILTLLYWEYKGQDAYCWCYELTVEGIGYVFDKFFVHGGKRCQIIEMENDARSNTTKIIALITGVDE